MKKSEIKRLKVSFGHIDDWSFSDWEDS